MGHKVHIVAPEWHGDWIIARLARYLIEGNGWTCGETADPRADCNVYMPYLMWDKSPCAERPSVGWFTHLESMTPGKAAAWERIAQHVTMRASQARLYLDNLTTYGPTLWVPSPVERDKFFIQERVRHPKPIIGEAGFVYPSKRKGEDLLGRLQRERGHEWTLRGAGRGWPVPTIHYPWENLQLFYWGLDLYLCTSTCEGGPVSPFEALACGVPVVVPSGVGLMDELPEMAGIHHYTAGDYDAMIQAIEAALATESDPEALRWVTDPYIVSRWCAELRAATERAIEGSQTTISPSQSDNAAMVSEAAAPAALIAPKPKRARKSKAVARVASQDVHRGVYVVAYGEPARKCAVTCLKSIRRYMPDVQIALAADKPLGVEDVYIPAPDADIGARSVKTEMYDVAPQWWEQALYLDADTELVAPVSYLYQVLDDGWDVVICVNPSKYATIRNMKRPDNLDECDYTYKQLGSEELSQLQGGVMAFQRNERTAAFFRAWHSEWQRYGKRDQAALLRALWAHPCKVYLLGNEWNLSTRYFDASRSAGIVHHQTEARRWKGIVKGRLDNSEAWAAVHPAAMGEAAK